MRKLDLQEWSAVAEIVGTVGIVISLLFVAYTVNRNTIELRSTNENATLQMGDEIIAGLLSNTDVFSIVDKRDNGQKLTPIENMGMNVFTIRLLNAWEMAFYRHLDGVYSPERWEAANEGYASGLIDGFSACDKECWEWYKTGYGADLVRHVDAVYERR
jgi:hypothetical protein